MFNQSTINLSSRAYGLMTRQEWQLFFFALLYACYWHVITPIQYTADSDSYLGAAYLLTGQPSVGMIPIFRPPGYPLFLAATGAVLPGSFLLLMLVQALLAAIVPVAVYRILKPEGEKLAMGAAILTTLSAVTTIHSNQVMTEALFIPLLMIGLSLVVSLLRNLPTAHMSRLYAIAFIFAWLNAVRPTVAVIFWLLLIIIVVAWWRAGYWPIIRKRLCLAAALFMGLMSCWVIVDDILYAPSARYSRMVPIGATMGGLSDKLDAYIYYLPFTEAYFDPWRKRVEHIEQDPLVHGSLMHRPAMAEVKQVVLDYIQQHQNALTADTSTYPEHLFARYAANPEVLANRIFALPNSDYAALIHTAVNSKLSQEAKKKLLYAAASEAGYTWPTRWFRQFYESPLSPLLGPPRGRGLMKFLLAFSPLRHYTTIDDTGGTRSIVEPQNGPASKLYFSILHETLASSPRLWLEYDELAHFVDDPEHLTEATITNPLNARGWQITVLLWDVMGFDTAADLLNQVATEALLKHYQALLLRGWKTMLVVAAGPGYMRFDDSVLDFADVTIYDNMPTKQLTMRQTNELAATDYRKDDPTRQALRAPITYSYQLFYLLKPLCFFGALFAIVLLWARGKPIVVPVVLLLPHVVSVGIYGMFVTALPRYMDQTIILPMLVTCMAWPELCKRPQT